MQDTFKNIFKRYYPVARRFALMFVKREEDAEDIAQEVFAALWPKADIWQDNPQIDRYICRMTRNICLNHIKRKYADPVAMSQPVDETLAKEIIGDTLTPAEEIYIEELRLLIHMAIESMPPRRRQIFAMSRFEGMNNKDIADMLGLSVRTVESHIFSALNDLRMQIKAIVAILVALNYF